MVSKKRKGSSLVKKDSRVRGYVFTFNNYTEENYQELVNWKSLGAAKVQYIVFGKEVAPGTGTPHLQGFVYFDSKVSFNALKKFNSKIRWEEKLGTFEQAIKYCKKDGIVFEQGVQPMDPKAKGRFIFVDDEQIVYDFLKECFLNRNIHRLDNFVCEYPRVFEYMNYICDIYNFSTRVCVSDSDSDSDSSIVPM